MRHLWILFLAPLSMCAGTWYVRADGGTAMQCTGQTDAPYPGTGTTQPCAFKNPFYLWTTDPPPSQPSEIPQWKIAGGDTVIIRNGDYHMGYKSPDATGWWNYLGCRDNNHGCYNPPIPAGTDAAPTRIVGEEWQSGCSSKPVLRGGGGAGTVLNLVDTNHVDVECLEFTDAAQCRTATVPGEPYGCVNYQSDDAYAALQTNRSTSYLTLRNLFIHGMATAGIFGNIGGNVLAENLRLRGNGNIGWDFDPGDGALSVGPLTIRNTIIEWSACIERYPLADPAIVGCYDEAGANADGDGIGFVDLSGDIIIDNTIVRYNQRDGLDAPYVKSGKLLSITNSQFYGNSGQQIKTGGAANTIIRNNLVVGNCARQTQPVAGVTADNYNRYQKDFCPASGPVGVIFKNGTSARLENNSMVTYHPTAFDIQCATITDTFTSSGRSSTDGSIVPSQAPDGSRKSFTTAFPIQSMKMSGSVYVSPQAGDGLGKRVGRTGIDQDCNGSPCQYWYTPGASTLIADPSEPILLPTDTLSVTYSNAALCNDSTMIFANNVLRGYQRPGDSEMAGPFSSNNLLSGSLLDNPNARLNNVYCGMNAFPHNPTEVVFPTCPGTFFSNEPPTFTTEDQLDALDLYPQPQSPVVDRGTSISDLTSDFGGNPRPYGSAYDVGAYETAPGRDRASRGAPRLIISSNTVNLGMVSVGTITAQTLTVRNGGGSNLIISNVVVSGSSAADFATSSSCGDILAADASCTMTLQFSPTAGGPRSATLSIGSNSVDSPGVVNLRGTGLPAFARAALSSTRLTFSELPVGGTSQDLTVGLSNTGDSPLQVAGIAMSGFDSDEFTETDNCPSSIVPNAGCTITVRFAPTRLGWSTATLLIASSSADSPATVALNGWACSPLMLSGSMVSFGAQTLNGMASRKVTLMNIGTQAVAVNGIEIDGRYADGANPEDFRETNDCPASLAPSAQCIITIQFVPSATGARLGVLSVASNAAGSPLAIGLTGTGIASGELTISTNQLLYGGQALGSSSSKSVVVSSTGTSPLLISRVTIAGGDPADFRQTNDCPFSLAPNASCTVTILFAPSAIGPRRAALCIASSAGEPCNVGVAGTGYALQAF